MEIRNGVQTGYNPGLGTEYEVQANRWKQRQQVYGDIDFKSNLFMIKSLFFSRFKKNHPDPVDIISYWNSISGFK